MLPRSSLMEFATILSAINQYCLNINNLIDNITKTIGLLKQLNRTTVFSFKTEDFPKEAFVKLTYLSAEKQEEKRKPLEERLLQLKTKFTLLDDYYNQLCVFSPTRPAAPPAPTRPQGPYQPPKREKLSELRQQRETAYHAYRSRLFKNISQELTLPESDKAVIEKITDIVANYICRP